jgi:hypothetical protein
VVPGHPTPAGFEDFAAEIGRPAGDSGLPEPSAPDIPRLMEASSRYGQHILGPSSGQAAIPADGTHA